MAEVKVPEPLPRAEPAFQMKGIAHRTQTDPSNPDRGMTKMIKRWERNGDGRGKYYYTGHSVISAQGSEENVHIEPITPFTGDCDTSDMPEFVARLTQLENEYETLPADRRQTLETAHKNASSQTDSDPELRKFGVVLDQEDLARDFNQWDKF